MTHVFSEISVAVGGEVLSSGRSEENVRRIRAGKEEQQ